MCTFLSIITEDFIENAFIQNYKSKGVHIDNVTEYVLHRANNKYYYFVTNGHCSCGIFDSDKSGQIWRIIKYCLSISNVILIYYDDNGKFDLSENLEDIFNDSLKIHINSDEFLKTLPLDLEHNVAYCLNRLKEKSMNDEFITRQQNVPHFYKWRVPL